MFLPLRFNIELVLVSALAIAISASFCAVGSAFADENVSVTDAPIHKGNVQVGMMTNYRSTNGTFDPYGTYSAYPDGSSVWSIIQVYNVSYRFDSPLEIGLSFATRDSQSAFPTGDSSSESFGSPSINARYHFLLDHETHLIVHAGFGTPWKFSNRKTNGDPAASQSTDGDLSAPVGAPMGGYSIRVGTGISKSLRHIPLRFSVDGTVAHSFASTTPVMDGPQDGLTQDVQRGNQYSLSEGAGYSLTRFWLVSGGFRQAWSTDTYTDGEDMAGTSSRLISTNIGLTYIAKEDWRVTANYDTQWPFYNYIVNQPYAPSVSVGLTYTGL